MKLLVTGARGFLAQAYLRAAEGRHQVTTLVRGDDPAALTGPVEAMLHAAIRSRPHEYHQDPRGALADNVGLTHELLLKARELGCGHFLFLSTGSVYAPGPGPNQEGDPAPGDGSLYAATKVMAEALVRAYSPRPPATILRLYHPYGPGLPSWHLLARLCRALQEEREISVGAGGTPLMSWLHLDDLVEALEACLGSPPGREGGPRVLNLAHPQPMLLGEVVERLAAALGVRPRLREEPQPRPAQAARVEALARELGVTPRISLAQGLDTILDSLA